MVVSSEIFTDFAVNSAYFSSVLKTRQIRKTRLQVDGKFFLLDGERVFINAVTYGPFPDPQPTPDRYLADLKQIAKAGFNAIRIYEAPTLELLNAAYAHGVMIFAGIHWSWDRVFRGVDAEKYLIEGKLRIAKFLKQWANHPALVGIYVANEIRSDIARWQGPAKTKQGIEELIDLVHELAPQLLAAYANYPSSEYLEPENADFTGFNIYLEDEQNFTDYLARLHHLAGDRPVLLSELGMDTQSNGEEKQAELLVWSRQAALNTGMAGTTIFAWSDNWRVGTRVETDWDFGITRRDGSAKASLDALTEMNELKLKPNSFPLPKISVIICVYNGVDRVWKAIDSLIHVNYPSDKFEVIVVDDGSNDGTQKRVANYLETFPNLKLIRAAHGGLSNARNLGARAATGSIFAYTDDDCEADQDWLYWIARGYHELGVDAMGGPNIPPTPTGEDEAVVAAAPGAPSHVMLSDRLAEHIPGCNLTVSRFAFESIGGFSKTYRVAGDDVDFCWRLENAGFKIGFHGAAFVWHRRRTSFFNYFKQQRGYGKAEALLMRDHPEKFTRGNGAIWKGCVYTGGALGAHEGSFIYSGEAGSGAYQQVTTHMMPLRKIHPSFATPPALRKLRIATYLQPKIRRWARWYYSRKWYKIIRKAPKTDDLKASASEALQQEETSQYSADGNARYTLIQKYLEQGWLEDHGYSEWDLIKDNQKLLIAQEMVGKDLWLIRERRELQIL